MDFNSIVFPQKSTYTSTTFPNLLQIPKGPLNYCKSQNGQLYYYSKKQIPCIYLPSAKSQLLMIYFHGNAEDLRDCSEFLTSFRDTLKINILAFEYPGYGIYQGKPSAKKIIKDSEIVYNYMVNQCGFREENIILFGRSIGTGSATALASKKKFIFYYYYQIIRCKQLILMSGFITLRSIVKELFGTFASYFVAERFKNIDLIEKVQCPVLLIHGKKDGLISYKQSIELLKHCKSIKQSNFNQTIQGPCSYYFPEEMTHNNFNLYQDIIYPIKNALEHKFTNKNSNTNNFNHTKPQISIY